MRVTITQLTAGQVALPDRTKLAAIDFDELPVELRARAATLLSPGTIARYTREPVIPGSADRGSFEIDYVTADGMQRVLVDEAACTAEFLDLLDELAESCPGT